MLNSCQRLFGLEAVAVYLVEGSRVNGVAQRGWDPATGGAKLSRSKAAPPGAIRSPSAARVMSPIMVADARHSRRQEFTLA